ncbi:hypothetical protein [Sphingomonas sp. LHG3406-1]|uniref:hypothetical protein n=1 Tax=Sphingomonas sp. LHG3406-1 TaxID=2804617 RepID=UPI002603490C|nr:hypothetical protein [Sphingomonas sp. LHG3406-1]
MRRPRVLALPFSVRLGGPHPLKFGHGRRWLLEWAEKLPQGWSDDARLFAGAYAAGFVAISLFIA